MKTLIAIGILLLAVSCGTPGRLEAEKIISRFEKEKVPDKRETIFETEVVFESGNLVLKGQTDDPELKQMLLDSLRRYKILDRMTLLPDSGIGDTPFALITVSAANFRTIPGFSSELVTQALLGTPVKILKKQGSWYLVQTPDRYISWTPSSGILPITSAELQTWKQAEKVIFTGSFTEVYSSEAFEVAIADVTMGGILEWVETTQQAIKVRFPDGREGYTTAQNWMPFSRFENETTPLPASVTNLAKTLKGRPYLWGGTSSLAMDCSGFTKMVYFMHGIILARDASLQARHGQPVEPSESFENLQPGDLLFFGHKEKDNQPERITHVAISLGKTEYIHASGKVEENSFDPESEVYSEYRKNSFIQARRVIGSEGSEGIQWVKDHLWY